MCAILLRKSVMSGLADGDSQSALSLLQPHTKQAVKAQLLQCISNETERDIRKKVCDAVGQLGVNTLTENIADWPELLPFMLQATRSGDANMHEASLVIFSALSDFIASKLKTCDAPPPRTASRAQLPRPGSSPPPDARTRPRDAPRLVCCAGTTRRCSRSSATRCRRTSRCRCTRPACVCQGLAACCDWRHHRRGACALWK
tara:strand:- start:185 stop:790 length:606 start_codon:yes stop_codon:yes gene_type:complete